MPFFCSKTFTVPAPVSQNFSFFYFQQKFQAKTALTRRRNFLILNDMKIQRT